MLDLSDLPVLSELNCNENQLAVLDLSGLPALSDLSCNENRLTSLDLRSCPDLLFLSCRSNHLTELNLTNCRYLSDFNMSPQILPQVDLYQDLNLSDIFGSENLDRIRSIDFDRATGMIRVSPAVIKQGYFSLTYAIPFKQGSTGMQIKFPVRCVHNYKADGDTGKCTLCGAVIRYSYAYCNHIFKEDKTSRTCTLCGYETKLIPYFLFHTPMLYICLAISVAYAIGVGIYIRYFRKNKNGHKRTA